MSIQEALSSTIHDYFSPENLQKKLEKSHPIGSKIPWQKNAKLWKLFEETYGDIEKEASETFQLVLEKKIADAYEANMMRLKQQRSMK
jgi:predicted component of type VI protein secretion system